MNARNDENPKVRNITDQAHGLRRLKNQNPVKVITVTGGKGGVGKTNICGNLAVALSMLGRRVMLLDADLGLANVDVMFGLQPRFNLADVVRAERSLDEIIVTGPEGVMVVPGASGLSSMANLTPAHHVVPGASGLSSMANLTPAHHVGIINAFNDLASPVDVFLVDTAAGIGDGVLRFAEAAHEVIVTVCDEPTSITDAYALIKLLSLERGVSRFRIVTNMTRQGGDGSRLFEKLLRITDRFLQVSMDHVGSIPFDDRVWRAVQLQTPFIQAFPSCLASSALKQFANRVDGWAIPQTARGHIEFFFERLLKLPNEPENIVA
jgi:flagellar biosynthesis protein FlhG